VPWLQQQGQKLPKLSRPRRQQERQTSKDYATHHQRTAVSFASTRLHARRYETSLTDLAPHEIARVVDTSDLDAIG